MAVGRKTSSKIFVKAIFGLIFSIRVPACYLGKVKKIYTNASFVQKDIPPKNWKTVKMTAPAVLELNLLTIALTTGEFLFQNKVHLFKMNTNIKWIKILAKTEVSLF